MFYVYNIELMPKKKFEWRKRDSIDAEVIKNYDEAI